MITKWIKNLNKKNQNKDKQITQFDVNRYNKLANNIINNNKQGLKDNHWLNEKFNMDTTKQNASIMGNILGASLVGKGLQGMVDQQKAIEKKQQRSTQKFVDNIVLSHMFNYKNKQLPNLVKDLESGLQRQRSLRQSIKQNTNGVEDTNEKKDIEKRVIEVYNNPDKSILFNDPYLIKKKDATLETIQEEQKGLNEQNQQSYKKATTMLSNFIGKEVNRNGNQSVVSNNIKYNFFKLKNQLQEEKQLENKIDQNSLKNMVRLSQDKKRYQQALQRQKEAMEKEQNKYKNKQSVEQTNASTTIFPKISNCHKPEATQNTQDLKQDVNGNKFPVNPELNVKEQQIVNEEKKNNEKDYKSRLEKKIDASNKLPPLKQKKNVEEIKEEIKQKELDYVADIMRQKEQEKNYEPQKQDPRETSFNGLGVPYGEPFKKAKKNKYKKIFQPRKNFPFLAINYEQVGNQVRQERTKNKKNFRNFSKNCDNMQREADLYYCGDINKLYKDKILNPTRERKKQANQNIFYYQFNGQRRNIISHNRLIDASLNSHKFLNNF